MSADEHQSHQETLNRVYLRPHSPTTSAALNGVYVTPMPPQLRTNTSGSISHGAAAEQSTECREQRLDRQNSGDDSLIGHQLRTNISSSVGHSSTAEQSGGGTWHDEQAGASWQSLQATAFQPVSKRKRGNNKRRRRKAWVKAANTDTEH